jgi:hypothetical protein
MDRGTDPCQRSRNARKQILLAIDFIYAVDIKLLFLVLVSLALVSCDEDSSRSFTGDRRLAAGVQASATIANQATNPSKEPANLAARSENIKGRIENYKEWGGGHSPVPRRAITSNTFEKVRQEISPEDSAALMILLQDNASDVRSIAASLLECVDPHAESEVEDQMNMESSSERKNRLRESLILIRTIRAGGTSCK